MLVLTTTRKVHLLCAAAVLSVFLGGGLFVATVFLYVAGNYPLALTLDGGAVLLLVLAFLSLSAASGVLDRETRKAGGR